MKNACLVFIFSFLFFSCGEKKTNVNIPDSVLAKEKMSAVITDIHLAEAEAHLHAFPDTVSKEKISFQKIFEKHGITRKQYEESISFYMEHPELLDKVYEQTLNELSRMQGEAAKQ